MNGVLSNYKGREQSYIKHRFLTEYLQGASYKIILGRSQIFNFVDAFAGPWQIGDNDNFSDASFDQALRTLEAVRESLVNRKLANPRIRFFFCEKRLKAVEKLRHYAEQNTKFKIYVFRGAFEDKLDEISKKLEDGFTFTFIDPTGWNIRNKEVFHFLQQREGEFLLNFMSDHINRHSGYDAVSESIGRFLADPGWKEDFDALPADWNNERKVLHLLKCQMKKARVATYLPDFSIMLPRQERLKMRLILGTHSLQGLELFRDTQPKIEEKQTEVRREIRENKTGLVSLFRPADLVKFDQQQKGVGSDQCKLSAKKQIVEMLKERSSMLYSELWPRIIENVAIRQIRVKGLVHEMKKNGLVYYDLPKGKHMPQPNTQIRLTEEGYSFE